MTRDGLTSLATFLRNLTDAHRLLSQGPQPSEPSACCVVKWNATISYTTLHLVDDVACIAECQVHPHQCAAPLRGHARDPKLK